MPFHRWQVRITPQLSRKKILQWGRHAVLRVASPGYLVSLLSCHMQSCRCKPDWLTGDALRPLLELSMKECPAPGSYSGGDASSLSASRPPTGPTASAVVNLGVVGRGNKRINLQPVTAASGAPAGAGDAGGYTPAQCSHSLIACRSGRSCLEKHQYLVIAQQQEWGLPRRAAWRPVQTKA